MPQHALPRRSKSRDGYSRNRGRTSKSGLNTWSSHSEKMSLAIISTRCALQCCAAMRRHGILFTLMVLRSLAKSQRSPSLARKIWHQHPLFPRQNQPHSRLQRRLQRRPQRRLQRRPQLRPQRRPQRRLLVHVPSRHSVELKLTRFLPSLPQPPLLSRILLLKIRHGAGVRTSGTRKTWPRMRGT